MDPQVPGPRLSTGLEPDGWDQIDRVGAWDSFLCEFRLLQFVLWQQRETWALACAEVFRKIQGAPDQKGLPLERGLKWL